MASELGPIYGVKLPTTLPIGIGGTGSMLQNMASRQDLEDVKEMSYRVVAAYEILSRHYWRLTEELEIAKAIRDTPPEWVPRFKSISTELETAMSRLNAMVDPDQQTWDLSHNDIEAIQLVLHTLSKLLKETP